MHGKDFYVAVEHSNCWKEFGLINTETNWIGSNFCIVEIDFIFNYQPSQSGLESLGNLASTRIQKNI